MKEHLIYEDDGILVCRKQAGIPVETKDLRTKDLVSMVRTYLQETTGNSYAAVINRLDQPVEGLVLFAKTKEAAKKLSLQLTSHGMGKNYYAVVTGNLTEEAGELIDYLKKDARKNTSVVVSAQEADAKRAELKYQVIEKREGKTLVKIHLITGRHHQIRVQFAHANAPLWGDTKYNEQFSNQRGVTVALCAYQLSFVHPMKNKKMQFEIKPEGAIFHEFTSLS